jgi:excisionase family DNA binding protein
VVSRWLTYDEVADYLKVSRATVFNMVRLGTIPAPRLFGKRIKRFDREAIDASPAPDTKSQPEPTLGDVEW